MSEQELCGLPTKSGKPCNMRKGHEAKFHRNRDYKLPLEWVIKTKAKKVLESGNGRKALGYAMTYWLKKDISLIIEVEP
jgi:hypothetical protein